MALHLRLARWAEDHPHSSNALFVTGCLLLSMLLFVFPVGEDPATLWCMPAVGLPLYFRRAAPVRSALAVGLVAIGALVIFNVATIAVSLWAVPWVVYTAAARSSAAGRRTVFAAALLGCVVFGLLSHRWFFVLPGSAPTTTEWLLTAAMFTLMSAAFCTVAFLAGDLARGRLRRREQLEDRARRLEIEREQEVRIAAQDERTRIAREMHDVVAHSLSVVIAQADGARYAAASDPHLAAEALETIAETARGSLAEMRKLLGVLRTGDDAETRPAPRLADIAELVASVRAAGLPVTLREAGTPHLGAGAQLTLYRVVQEGLTNVLKHAWQASAVRVVIEHRPAFSWVEITNDGAGARGARAPGAGQGLQGLRERVGLYGGELTAGPHASRPDVFVVRATIPTEDS